METLDYGLLIRLIVAHFISDFILQPAKWAGEKDEKGIRTRYFWYHIGVTAVIVYLACVSYEGWNCYILPIVITLSHILIDSLKLRFTRNKKTAELQQKAALRFVLDQIAHFVVLIAAWLFYTKQYNDFANKLCEINANNKIWWIIMGTGIVTIPSSVFINALLRTWNLESIKSNPSKKSKFAQSGKWVGIVERLLIYVFILIGKYEIIGFLIAAKSIFRYHSIKNDKDRRRVEYVLTGTLISISIAVATGLLVQYFI